MMGGLRFPTVPCSPGGEDGPSIVTLIEVCRSFLALDLVSVCRPRAVWRQCLHFRREREMPGYGRLSIWMNKMLLLLLPLPPLLLL